MKYQYFFILMFFFIMATISGQVENNFTMDLSSDTVLIGNTITLSYSIENVNGEFVAPDLSDFRIVSGPNVSSQYSSINGNVNQKNSYTYFLMPIRRGVANIGKARVGFKDKWITLDPVIITVMDNPYDMDIGYGMPLKQITNGIKGDTLTEKQKLLLQKLKTGKSRKI
ncbi:MAG: BatD family protein [Saprospiraceae bacterium]